jgi:trehalose 6-phosphate phosphatase
MPPDKRPMNILNDNIDLDQFFAELHEHASQLLMLDYDGTLAPFVARRERAEPYPGVREILKSIAADERCRTVIITGRPAAEIPPLLQQREPRLEIWGSHGWERLHADGRHVPPVLDDDTIAMLMEEWQWLCASFPSDRIERKPVSVALHWRGTAQGTMMTLHSLASKRWSTLHRLAAVELHEFDGGIELRARGRGKGDAVRTLLEESVAPYAAAYLGDDQTDEDAFAALEGRGLRVLVRREPRPTRADLHLVPPNELLLFLARWHEHL